MAARVDRLHDSRHLTDARDGPFGQFGEPSVDRVEFFRRPQTRAFGPYITDLERQIVYQFVLDREVPVLNVGHYSVIRIRLQSRDTVRHWDWIQRSDSACRQREYAGSHGRCDVQIL